MAAMRVVCFLILLTLAPFIRAQQSLTIDSCLLLSRDHYPMTRQLDIWKRLGQSQTRQLNTNWLPGVTINGQATIQSDVTSVTLPNIPGLPTITPPNKDQYKFYAEGAQMLYDGGSIHQQKLLSSLQNEAEQWKVEADLFKIKEKTIQTYFGVLLLQEQINVLSLSSKDLDALYDKTKVAFEAKASSGYQLYLVEAEKEKLQQRLIELNAQKLAALHVLESMIGREIPANTPLTKPQKIPINNDLNRPELKILNLSQRIFEVQHKLVKTKSIPRLSAFGQAGYANPALNFLKNEFQWYYIGGLRLNWNLSSLYTTGSEKKISLLNKDLASLQEETFIYNINLQQIQQIQETQKNEALLRSDQRLLELRTRIRAASKLQYDNGTLTLSDYLKDLNAEESARSNQLIHELSFLQSIYLTNHLHGNQ
ncbi:MAG TPA: TolC family protein [Saprospiraceae bacterium]|nr:TolC family protein [Saprospiraceae bacterium]